MNSQIITEYDHSCETYLNQIDTQGSPIGTQTWIPGTEKRNPLSRGWEIGDAQTPQEETIDCRWSIASLRPPGARP
ncbi:hypothetical protein Aspvir_000360 [Aspergillus viridinutans]|uniref:Uncharacterized protein n=1 Tax=Aspergillus viridinutans TaxID=75553 RepID=A0A9P3BQK8_ASPVI|nr:uncharacterized protein Aspvir_000360 [Aspergillus viridinutans]GIJ98245.1 hypothetical protein Aspvir_000360 [Aspergillus viridinutans]